MEKGKTHSVFSEEEFVISGNQAEHDYVDLGLPSGLKWAICNIGASSSEQSGDYFAWGETKSKKRYDEDNYEFYEVVDWEEEYDEEPDEDAPALYGTIEYNDHDGEVLKSEDDAAHVIWGDKWRMPTCEDCQELIDKCEITWGEYKETNGVKVKGPNGNSIFIPASGYFYQKVEEKRKSVCIASSTLSDSNDRNGQNDYYHAYVMTFYEDSSFMDGFSPREFGYNIRPVLHQLEESVD